MNILRWLREYLFREEYILLSQSRQFLQDQQLTICERIVAIEEKENLLDQQQADIEATKEEYDQRITAVKFVSEIVGIESRIETCTKKVVYHTIEGAQYAALALYHMDGRLVREYRCKICGKLHLTHSAVASALVGKELILRHTRQRFTATIAEILAAKGG